MILNIKKCFRAGTALVSLGDNLTCCGYYITGDELSCLVLHVSGLLSDAVCAGDSSVSCLPLDGARGIVLVEIVSLH